MHTAGSPERTLVKVNGVTVRIAGVEILDHVDLEIRTGAIVTLIGPNGSGKTTLVRVVLGLVQPNQGTVRRTAGIRIGYVPQHFHVDETLPISVRRFLSLAAPGASAGIDRTLAEVGAERTAELPLHRISGGELRRVLLARALLRQPELLVLDEPSAGMDITGQTELYAMVGALRDDRGCGVLLVSHDLHLVMAATDHVVCLNRHVCCSGRPDAVSAHPEYLGLFGREVIATHAVYTHHHDHAHDLAGRPLTDTEERPDSHG